VTYAKQRLSSINVDPHALIAAYDATMAPATPEWMAWRLNRLWKSSTPSGSLDATAWLHETGRLLSDIPQSILAAAIDEAVMKSTRGFMPSVGEIRAIAEPKMRDLRIERSRLQQVLEHVEEPPTAPEERCTPEQAAEILRQAGLHTESDTPDKPYIPVEQRPAPDAAWYRETYGIDPTVEAA
jgi:hypothetical protein